MWPAPQGDEGVNVEIDWNKFRKPGDWYALTHSPSYSMCRYWPSIQLLEFLPKEPSQYTFDMYLGVREDTFTRICEAGPFFPHVFDYYFGMTTEGYSRFRHKPIVSSKLGFSLPDRLPARPKSTSTFGYGAVDQHDEHGDSQD